MGRTWFDCWQALLSKGSSAVQFSRAYTAKRLFAFDEYCNTIPSWHVLLMLLLFGAPGVLLATILDAIPLQDPRAGWRANPNFWVRNFVTVIAISCVTLNQTRVVVPELKLSTARTLTTAAGVTIPYTFALMAIAHHWVFPVPFTLTLGAIPCGVCTELSVVTSLGCVNKQLIEKYLNYSQGMFVQMTMLIVYPTCSAIFLSLEGIPQLAFVLLLPAMKPSFKFVTRKVQSGDDDLLTALQSSVDMFDVLYTIKCMQSAGTLVVVFGIILVDLAQNYSAIHILATQTRRLQALTPRESAAVVTFSAKALVSYVLERLRNVQQLDRQDLRFGSRRLSISAQAEAELSRLQPLEQLVNSQSNNPTGFDDPGLQITSGKTEEAAVTSDNNAPAFSKKWQVRANLTAGALVLDALDVSVLGRVFITYVEDPASSDLLDEVMVSGSTREVVEEVSVVRYNEFGGVGGVVLLCGYKPMFEGTLLLTEVTLHRKRTVKKLRGSNQAVVLENVLFTKTKEDVEAIAATVPSSEISGLEISGGVFVSDKDAKLYLDGAIFEGGHLQVEVGELVTTRMIMNGGAVSIIADKISSPTPISANVSTGNGTICLSSGNALNVTELNPARCSQVSYPGKANAFPCVKCALPDQVPGKDT